jgi:hypothetical protein
MNAFQKDDRIAHTRFGPGVVVAVDARYTTIEFDESGVRKFVTALVQLERSDLPVPVKPPRVRRRRARAPGSTTTTRRSVAEVSQPETIQPVTPDLSEPEKSA